MQKYNVQRLSHRSTRTTGVGPKQAGESPLIRNKELKNMLEYSEEDIVSTTIYGAVLIANDTV